MIKDGKGGANTKTGLIFEERVDLITLFENLQGYSLELTQNNAGARIFYEG